MHLCMTLEDVLVDALKTHQLGHLCMLFRVLAGHCGDNQSSEAFSWGQRNLDLIHFIDFLPFFSGETTCSEFLCTEPFRNWSTLTGRNLPLWNRRFFPFIEEGMQIYMYFDSFNIPLYIYSYSQIAHICRLHCLPIWNIIFSSYGQCCVTRLHQCLHDVALRLCDQCVASMDQWLRKV